MQIQPDRTLTPAAAGAVRYLTITITAPERERRAERPASKFVTGLDGGCAAGATRAGARAAPD